MIMKVYLSEDIVSTLRYFGDLSAVVNKILEAGANNDIDITDKPTAPKRVDGSYYSIDVTEPTYLALLNIYGPKSSRISLRRLLYWFVDNDMFDELEWDSSAKQKMSNSDSALSVINEMRLLIKKLLRYTNQRELIAAIRTNLNEIEENLCND